VSVAPLDLDGARALTADARVDDAGGDVARTLVALSRIARAYPQIESMDVNPLIVTPAGAIAVDALVVIRPALLIKRAFHG
jgi:succinyl-CoA synthetase beta subunit